ncbi:hypothetical protein PoB_002518600 [Plakobranchus ocellatus]|uniref:Uncharacterized protein n=1 Tax=Plakobranchus ocellatus TaxID=259542 RepID=A0AAV3ZVX5_9GAST|nr:hypothetical protein PoB_002518600 [Plakobranchus ocellatus]
MKKQTTSHRLNNQLINLPIDRHQPPKPRRLTDNYPFNRPNEQSAKQLNYQPNERPNEQSLNRPNQPTNRPTHYQPTNKSANKPTNSSTKQLIS